MQSWLKDLMYFKQIPGFSQDVCGCTLDRNYMSLMSLMRLMRLMRLVRLVRLIHEVIVNSS